MQCNHPVNVETLLYFVYLLEVFIEYISHANLPIIFYVKLHGHLCFFLATRFMYFRNALLADVFEPIEHDLPD